MRRLAPLFLLALLLGCATTTIDHGVPNLVQVRPNVYRSGQPTDEGWRYLRGLFGSRQAHVLKLNFADEGSDDFARTLGFDIHSLGIEPRTNPDGAIHAVAEVFERPASDVWSEVERQILTIPKIDDGQIWLIHCVNGHDRTGLAVGHVRVMIEGWSKRDAWKEMIARGYHPELVGLDRQWGMLPESKR